VNEKGYALYKYNRYLKIFRKGGRGGGGMKERVRELGMERYTKEAERR